MKPAHLVPALVLGLAFLPDAQPYNEPTHRILSEHAVDTSLLGQVGGDLLGGLGLKPSAGRAGELFPNSQGSGLRSISELIQDGAEFEDKPPRPVNHFYDPVNGAALQFSSPHWALELPHPNEHPILGQRFSWREGRKYFLKALTEPAKAERERNWGLTFETVGHVIHHIQDMAQPQHVRLDTHLSFADVYEREMPFENRSRYERYSQEKGTGLPFSAPDYWPGGPVVFKKPRDFWASPEGDGMALFTSTNFVSDGTNFRLLDGVPAAGSRYSLPAPMEFLPPVPVEQLYAEAGLPVPEEMRAWCQDRGLDCRMSFVRTKVEDPKFEFTRHNDRAAAFSVFDQDLKPDRRAVYTDPDTGAIHAVDRVFSLNQFNFDEAHKFLIPRAVAYSAGLIDHFFRGRIDFTSDPENPGRYRIDNLGSEALLGEFALYYDDRDGNRHLVPDARWKDVALLPGDGLGNLSIGIPVEPEPAIPGEYMLVFKGSLGEEKAEEGLAGFLGGFIGAVAGRKIARPGYLLITSRVSEDTYRAHRSRDLGQTWEDLGTYYDPGQGALYAGSEHVMSTGSLSADGGRTWTAFPVSNPEAGLRNADLRSRATALGGGRMLSTLHYDDPATPDRELSVQIWQSADWGASWTAGPVSDALTGYAGPAVHLGDGTLVMKSFYPVGWREGCLGGLDCLDIRPALYRSADGGVTWAMIYAGSELDRIAHLGKARDLNGRLVPDPAGSSVLLAHTYEGGQPRFLRSLDGGVTWQDAGAPGGLPGGFVLWYLAYGGEGVVLAYFSDNVSQHQLYVSTDYGTTWRLSGPLPERTAEPGLYGMTYVGETRAVMGWR